MFLSTYLFTFLSFYSSHLLAWAKPLLVCIPWGLREGSFLKTRLSFINTGSHNCPWYPSFFSLYNFAFLLTAVSFSFHLWKTHFFFIMFFLGVKRTLWISLEVLHKSPIPNLSLIIFFLLYTIYDYTRLLPSSLQLNDDNGTTAMFTIIRYFASGALSIWALFARYILKVRYILLSRQSRYVSSRLWNPVVRWILRDLYS